MPPSPQTVFPTDRELIEDIRAGRPRRFDLLVERHLPRLIGFLHAYGVPADMVDDMAQETFLKAFRFLQSYDSSRSFTTWLTVIGRNVYLDMVRSRKVQQGSALRASDGETAPGPEEEVVARSTASELLHALPPGERLLIEWRIYEDLPFSEIAERLGEREDTVRSRFHRALGKLRLADSKKEVNNAN